MCLPAKAIASITGGTIAFGSQHSITISTEASFKKETKKLYKKKEENKEYHNEESEEAFEIECILKIKPVVLQSALVSL